MPPAQPQAKQQIAERLKTANNVLVSVSTNPSVDQLAAAIGFTLLLNKLGKHGTAVFSGTVPSTLEFLRPEATLEKNTDSLRDFIVALDKSKADRLRYKVEDKLVKIFITPYRTSISEKDLGFSQGDFNVDVVVALGVKEQKDLDSAITAHGRILHDAAVISITNQDKSNLGTLNWSDPNASSLCELLTSLSDLLGPNLLDAQIATAFLTGIVAETERFSNDKTAPATMTLAARLMSAGANQQLIASKLEEPKPAPPPPPPPAPKSKPAPITPRPASTPKAETPPPASDGALKIDHGSSATKPATTKPEQPEANDQIDIDTQGTLHRLDLERKRLEEEAKQKRADELGKESRMILEPPTLKSRLTANTEPEALDPSSDPLSQPAAPSPLLSHTPPPQPSRPPAPSLSPASLPTQTPTDPTANSTTPVPAANQPVPDPNQARSAVAEALQSTPAGSRPLPPIQALNAHPMDMETKPPVEQSAPPPPTSPSTPAPSAPTGLPANLVPPNPQATSTTDRSGQVAPPPPVPPPMMPPPFGKPPDDVDDVAAQEPLAPL